MDGYRLPRPRICSEEIYDLMLRCWETSPKERPDFDDLSLALSRLHNHPPPDVEISTDQAQEDDIELHEYLDFVKRTGIPARISRSRVSLSDSVPRSSVSFSRMSTDGSTAAAVATAWSSRRGSAEAQATSPREPEYLQFPGPSPRVSLY